MPACRECRYWDLLQSCHRYPQFVMHGPDDWCGEYAEPKKPVPLCSRMKLDGTPCTAPALAGRDVCLGHSDKKRNK